MIDLTNPEVFTREFFSAANNTVPSGPGPKDDTQWFGERMQEIAKKANLYCQNKESKPFRGEWMKVDHVFICRNTYDSFPLIAVEHENGNVSKATASGELPEGTAAGTYVEWAFWKSLTMRSKLAVLVAYPWVDKEGAVLGVLAKMVQGFRATYGSTPNVLLLMGWWRNAKWTSAETLYTAYVAKELGDAVEFVPLR